MKTTVTTKGSKISSLTNDEQQAAYERADDRGSDDANRQCRGTICLVRIILAIIRVVAFPRFVNASENQDINPT